MSFNQKYQKHGFDLPKDYFNTLENKILEKTPQLGTPRRKRKVIHMNTTLLVGAAAAIALVFWLLPIDANKAAPNQGPLTQDTPVELEFYEKDEDSWTQYAELHLSAEDFIPILTPEDIDLLVADSQEWDELSKQSTNIEYLFEEFNLIP